MSTIAIRKKLTDYLKAADDKKVQAIYTMAEDEINTAANDWDENFIKELRSRSRGFASGKSKRFSWEETKQVAMKKVESKRR